MQRYPDIDKEKLIESDEDVQEQPLTRQGHTTVTTGQQDLLRRALAPHHPCDSIAAQPPEALAQQSTAAHTPSTSSDFCKTSDESLSSLARSSKRSSGMYSMARQNGHILYSIGGWIHTYGTTL